MPELPEVETIRKGLSTKISGKVIRKVDILLPKISRNEPQKLQSLLVGLKIEKVNRKGKFLILKLKPQGFLLFHLKMSGQLIYLENNQSLAKHTHAIFEFTDGSQLRYIDMRQFGYLKYVKNLKQAKELSSLGPEPIDKALTLTQFKNRLAKRPRSRIKQLLLDQSLISGIGNIYADEILFSAGINPLRRTVSLSAIEIEKIFFSAKKILKEAIKEKGTSISLYVDHLGQTGNYANKLRVYGRKGLPCSKCKTPIQKIKLSGRGTHYCPSCQPDKSY